MQTDFLDAHERHLEDAKMLHENERLANADHLYGMSAECGLKWLMLAFGMSFDSDRDRPEKDKDRKHVDMIWHRYEVYRSGHHLGIGYALPAQNPFDDWNANQRYAHRSNFDAARVQKHRTGAEEVRNMVKKAKLEGLNDHLR